MADDSEEVYLSEPESGADLDSPMSGDEELDTNVHEQATQDIPRADEADEDDAAPRTPTVGSAVAAIAQETAAAAAGNRKPAEAEANAASAQESAAAAAQPPAAEPAAAEAAANGHLSGDSRAGSTDTAAAAAAAADEPTAAQPDAAAAPPTAAAEQQQQEAPPPAAAAAEAQPGPSESTAAKPVGLGSSSLNASGPKGLGGLGLKPPAQRTSDAAATAAARQADQQQQQQPSEHQQQPPAAQAAAPKGLGLGGLGPKLPPKSSAASAASEAAKPAAAAAEGPAAPAAALGSSRPSLPARPAGGLGLLPPKTKPAAAAGTSSSGPPPPPPLPPQQQQQQQQAAKPAGGVGGLPAKQPAGGLPALGPRPAAAAGSSSSSTPAAAAKPPSSGSSFRPVLPGRPAAASSTTPSAGSTALAATRSNPVVAARSGTAGSSSSSSSGVVDADEPKNMQKLRRQIQDLRLNLIRAAVSLGLSASNEQLGQYLGVLDRLEKVQAPSAKPRPDVSKLAVQEALELNESEGPDSKLGTHLVILVIGMTGTGKSELINRVLDKPVLGTSAFRDSTKRIRIVKGQVAGVTMTFIDTPGLHASSDAQISNRNILKGIKRVFNRRKANFVLYVDRLDAARPGFGELGVLTTITSTLGQGVWKKTMVVLTHANAAREKLGKEYPAVSKQRRNILQNILRQAAGEMQLRTPFHLVDLHPEGPRSQSGQPIIFDQVGMLTLSAVPWRQNLLVMLLGLYAYETAQQLLQKKATKGKTGAAAAKQPDMFKQMMRSRLPPTNYFVEQLVEGVTKPDGWAVPEDPFGAETDDEEAEDFRAIYHKLMWAMAKRGDLRAQKAYAAWLRKLDKAKRAYKEAYDNEELETLAAYGYEGYVAEGLDLGPTFDPEDVTDHRYQYLVGDNPVSIMPTLDYYGYEHEDAITGFVAEYSAQPFNRDGWGGYPVDVTATIEKDKTNTCLQAEASTSIVHTTAAFGSRHITQVAGAFELLRPSVKDILYTLEVNTFKDGLIKGNDHAGCGLLVTRMGEGGNVRKGPVAVGVRMQETMRVGPFKVEAVAAQVRGETPMGGKDEGWAARAFVLYDYIPGLAMNFDWYQERTKDESSTIGGWATSMAYDFDLPGGYPAGVEVDWVAGSDVMHVDMNVFSARDWKLSWLLLLPAVNYAKDSIRRLRSRKQDEVLVQEEEEEEDGMAAGGMDLQSMLQGMSGPDAQQMLQQLMQSGQLQQLMGGRMG